MADTKPAPIPPHLLIALQKIASGQLREVSLAEERALRSAGLIRGHDLTEKGRAVLAAAEHGPRCDGNVYERGGPFDCPGGGASCAGENSVIEAAAGASPHTLDMLRRVESGVLIPFEDSIDLQGLVETDGPDARKTKLTEAGKNLLAAGMRPAPVPAPTPHTIAMLRLVEAGDIISFESEIELVQQGLVACWETNANGESETFKKPFLTAAGKEVLAKASPPAPAIEQPTVHVIPVDLIEPLRAIAAGDWPRVPFETRARTVRRRAADRETQAYPDAKGDAARLRSAATYLAIVANAPTPADPPELAADAWVQALRNGIRPAQGMSLPGAIIEVREALRASAHESLLDAAKRVATRAYAAADEVVIRGAEDGVLFRVTRVHDKCCPPWRFRVVRGELESGASCCQNLDNLLSALRSLGQTPSPDIDAAVPLLQAMDERHGVEAPQAEKRVTWRGSPTDLATDLKPLLTEAQRSALIDALACGLAVPIPAHIEKAPVGEAVRCESFEDVRRAFGEPARACPHCGKVGTLVQRETAWARFKVCAGPAGCGRSSGEEPMTPSPVPGDPTDKRHIFHKTAVPPASMTPAELRDEVARHRALLPVLRSLWDVLGPQDGETLYTAAQRMQSERDRLRAGERRAHGAEREAKTLRDLLVNQDPETAQAVLLMVREALGLKPGDGVSLVDAATTAKMALDDIARALHMTPGLLAARAIARAVEAVVDRVEALRVTMGVGLNAPTDTIASRLDLMLLAAKRAPRLSAKEDWIETIAKSLRVTVDDGESLALAVERVVDRVIDLCGQLGVNPTGSVENTVALLQGATSALGRRGRRPPTLSQDDAEKLAKVFTTCPDGVAPVTHRGRVALNLMQLDQGKRVTEWRDDAETN